VQVADAEAQVGVELTFANGGGDVRGRGGCGQRGGGKQDGERAEH
jgi:hypothetical protein